MESKEQVKHTPGPWKVLPEEVDKQYLRIRGPKLGGRYKFANVLTPVYEGVHKREAEETRANARLIAAAPDLLVALRGMVEEAMLPQPRMNTWIHQARAAIAKATGEKHGT